MPKNKKQKNNNDTKKGFMLLFKYAMRHKKEILTILSFSAVLGFIGSISPYLFGYVIDIFTGQKSFNISGYNPYISIMVIYVVLSVISVFLVFFKDIRTQYLDNKIFAQYMSDGYEKILKLPFSFHKTKKYGSWSFAFQRASRSLAWIVSNKFSAILPELFVLFFALVISFLINPVLSLVILTGVVSYSLVVYRSTVKIKEFSRIENKKYKKVNSAFFETFSNIFEVKKSSADEPEVKKFIKKNTDYLKSMNRLSKAWKLTSFYRSLIASITRLSILVIGLYFAYEGIISVGEVVTLNAYALRVFRPLEMISNSWTYVIESLVKINDTEDILNKTPEIYEPKNSKKLPKDFKGEIEFDDVEFSYADKDKKILKKVNLQIEKGQKVAFVGESGVGKSTAIDLIGGFYFPQKGSVKIDGIDSKKLGLEDLRSKIAFVSQDISLFNDTVENNIKYGSKRVSKEKVIEASKKAFADEFIKDFPKKYKQKVGNRGIKLSGGQKQRISIARAILRDPKILILDEPTSSLDIKSEKHITESLDSLMEGRTTIIIAHRLSTVRNVDKIFVFKGGKIVEEGSHRELLAKNGEYKNMHDMHIGLN